MKNLNIKENNTIERELNAFLDNFEEIAIYKEGNSYFIFLKNDITENIMEWHDKYIHYASNIEYIRGWLYGCVQANNKRVKSTR